MHQPWCNPFRALIAHVVRLYADLTLLGSDDRTYRATAFAHERVTLVAPDLENPTYVKEVNGTTFYGGPNGSPGWVHEVLKINHGTRVDKVTGPCSFADQPASIQPRSP